MSLGRAAVVLFLCTSCRERAQPTPDAQPPAAAARSGQPDSLALRAPDGTEVWFTAGRPATDSTGRACSERTLEIRRPDGSRTPIPLLYTGEVPKLVNDSTIRAHIWLHCRPGNLYQVNLLSGHPERVP